MQEEFRIIKDYENYSISNLGNVRNDKRGIMLKPWNNDSGYKLVTLYGKKLRVHILIAKAFLENPDNKPFVDHIDCDRSNNNVSNLRWSSKSENNWNQSTSCANTSGVKGLSWHKKANKWQVEIKHKGKYYYLGLFSDKDEAIKIRKLKANELFGEFCHKSEKIVNLNIKIPKNTKLNINIVVEDDLEELKLLEEEFLEKLK